MKLIKLRGIFHMSSKTTRLSDSRFTTIDKKYNKMHKQSSNVIQKPSFISTRHLPKPPHVKSKSTTYIKVEKYIKILDDNIISSKITKGKEKAHQVKTAQQNGKAIKVKQIDENMLPESPKRLQHGEISSTQKRTARNALPKLKKHDSVNKSYSCKKERCQFSPHDLNEEIPWFSKGNDKFSSTQLQKVLNNQMYRSKLTNSHIDTCNKKSVPHNYAAEDCSSACRISKQKTLKSFYTDNVSVTNREHRPKKSVVNEVNKAKILEKLLKTKGSIGKRGKLLRRQKRQQNPNRTELKEPIRKTNYARKKVKSIAVNKCSGKLTGVLKSATAKVQATTEKEFDYAMVKNGDVPTNTSENHKLSTTEICNNNNNNNATGNRSIKDVTVWNDKTQSESHNTTTIFQQQNIYQVDNKSSDSKVQLLQEITCNTIVMKGDEKTAKNPKEILMDISRNGNKTISVLNDQMSSTLQESLEHLNQIYELAWNYLSSVDQSNNYNFTERHSEIVANDFDDVTDFARDFETTNLSAENGMVGPSPPREKIEADVEEKTSTYQVTLHNCLVLKLA